MTTNHLPRWTEAEAVANLRSYWYFETGNGKQFHALDARTALDAAMAEGCGDVLVVARTRLNDYVGPARLTTPTVVAWVVAREVDALVDPDECQAVADRANAVRDARRRMRLADTMSDDERYSDFRNES